MLKWCQHMVIAAMYTYVSTDPEKQNKWNEIRVRVVYTLTLGSDVELKVMEARPAKVAHFDEVGLKRHFYTQ